MHSVSFWLEKDQKVHKREWHFMLLAPLLAEIKYPVDLFVRFQPQADELGVPDWDPEQYELLVFWVADERAASGYGRRDEIALDGVGVDKDDRGATITTTTMPPSPPPTRVLALGVAELRAMLEAMERRHWNDIFYARERGPAEREDGEEEGVRGRARRPPFGNVAGLVMNMRNMEI